MSVMFEGAPSYTHQTSWWEITSSGLRATTSTARRPRSRTHFSGPRFTRSARPLDPADSRTVGEPSPPGVAPGTTCRGSRERVFLFARSFRPPWQTETGGIMITPCRHQAMKRRLGRHASAGFAVRALDEEGQGGSATPGPPTLHGRGLGDASRASTAEMTVCETTSREGRPRHLPLFGDGLAPGPPTATSGHRPASTMLNSLRAPPVDGRSSRPRLVIRRSPIAQ